MATIERVTVSLPVDLVESIGRFEHNRSRFIAEAVKHELVRRRRREGLLRSLKSPHPEATDLSETGLADWGASLPDNDRLVDESAGKPVRWVEGQGWVEVSE